MLDLRAFLIAAVVAALVAAPPALGARAAAPPPSSSGLLELDSHAHALVQLSRGSLAAEGGELIAPSLAVWRLPTATALRILPRLLARGDVRAVEPDRPVRLLAVEADPLSGGEWWRAHIGADRVAPPGPGKPLTIVDTGLDAAHPEFGGRPNTFFLNGQRLDESDSEWHGTAVASLAAAPENGVGMAGVYPQARLQAWDAGPPSLGRVLEGIQAAIRSGPGVVNLSLGFDFVSDTVPVLTDAVNAAFKAGVLVVAAAGNEGQAGSPPSVPANLPHVLTVAATNPAGRVSSFSTVSPAIDLAAPGEDVVAALNRTWAPVAGTSFAAPIVAGATAWVWTARPQLEKTQLFQVMRSSARDIEQPGLDPYTGFGMLDIPAALARPAPAIDPQEPNEDVRYVRARGLFRAASPPLTTPRRGRAALGAHLDAVEDPEDVYRVWVPAGRVVRVRVTMNTDVDVDFWNASTTSVFVRGADRRRHLVATSARRGRVTEQVTIRNKGRRGYYGYLDVFLSRGGPREADYRFTIATAQQ